VIVLVHGVPETDGLWRKLRSRLGADSVALSMPGFGCPRPAGFGATKDEYVAWLVDELDRIDGPIDLLGHDWGAGLTYRVATAYGDRLHSWAADVANIMHPEYHWHDVARIWQTPGEGEAFFTGQLGTPATERAQVFEAFGVGHEDALEIVAVPVEPMGSCILDLYRSATPNPYADWQDAWGATGAPGLVLCPTEDPFGDQARSLEVAESLGARHELIEGAGHWWPVQAPDAAAAIYRSFLGSLD
jgi:pimeloyl-ACP methyl ester carboxylesterase